MRDMACYQVLNCIAFWLRARGVLMKETNLVIIVLLLANLAATIWFGVNNGGSAQGSAAQYNSSQALPAVISKEVRSNIFESIKENFNSRNYEELYAILGPAVQARFSKEESFKTFEKLSDYFDSIESGAYSHSEFLGENGDARNYMLYYTIKLSDKSKFGNSGTLKVTIVVRGSEYEVYGLRINAGDA